MLANDKDIDDFDTKSLNTVPPLSSGGATLTPVQGGKIDYSTGTAFQYLRSGENATDTFTYIMQDAMGATSSAIVQISVRGVNDAPVAVADSASADEDGPAVTIDVLANDTDPDLGDTRRVISVTDSAGGAVVRIVNGKAVYTVGSLYQYLGAGQTAADSFTYVISDLEGTTSTGTVTVTVHGRNDTPGAANDTAVAYEDGGPVLIDALANDTDVDTASTRTLTGIPATSALGASLAIVTNQVQYDPGTIHQELGAGQVLFDTFSYSMTDSQGGVSAATVTMSFTGTDDAPAAFVDTGYAVEDGLPVDVAVLLNDTDIDTGDILSLLSVSPVSFQGAAVSVAGDFASYDVDGTFQSLGEGEVTADTFTYVVQDLSGLTASGSAIVYVSGHNDAPAAIGDSGSATEDGGPVLMDVLANDSDVDASDRKTLVSVPSISYEGARLSVVANQVLYNPGVLFQSLPVGGTHSDSFTYVMSDSAGASSQASVAVTVTGVNDVPVAHADSAAATEDGSPVSVAVIANDTDIDTGDTLSLASVTATSQGGATVTMSGTSAVYDPGNQFQSLNVGQTTTDSFTYTVQDNHGGQSQATVTVRITGTNDGPQVTTDQVTAHEDGGPVIVNILANDFDPDYASTILLVSNDAVSESGASVSRSINDVIYNPGSLFQDLAEGETATDTFGYTIEDEYFVTASGNAVVTVIGTNDAPVGVDDTASATEDGGTVSIDVLLNDSDADFTDTHTVSSLPFTSTGGALLSFNGTTVQYNPDIRFQNLRAGATATDSFTYRVRDQHGASSPATVTVTISGANDAPVAVADNVGLSDSVAASLIDVLANDTDVDDGDTKFLDIVPAASTNGATLSVVGNSVRYDPGNIYDYLADGQTGTDDFTYQMRDGSGATSSALVTISVTGGNIGPDAVDDDFTGTLILEDGPAVLLNVAANDTDPTTGDSLTVVGVSGSTAGAVVDVAANQARYHVGSLFQFLSDGETGSDAFTYTVSDRGGVTDTAVVQVQITGVNDVPLAIQDLVSVPENAATNVPWASFLLNDLDVDQSDTLTITGADAFTSVQGLPVAVTPTDIQIDTTGIDFVAAGGILNDSFIYTIQDNMGVSSSATVTLQITGVNDAPALNNPPPNTFCREGDTLSLFASVADVDTYPAASDTFSDAGTGSCTWVTVNPDGELTGTCPAMGTACTVDVTVDDGFATDTKTFTIGYNTRYVTTAGAGALDGTSWANAIPDSLADINTAIAALSGNGGGSVWFETGNYDDSFNTGAGLAQIGLSSGVYLYGGFAGTEAALTDRPSPAGTTQLVSDPSTNLLSGSGVSGVILDSLTLDGGAPRCLSLNFADDVLIQKLNVLNCNENGIYVNMPSGVTIRDTAVSGITGSTSPGAGIEIAGGATVLFDRVTVSGNDTSNSGGGLAVLSTVGVTFKDTVVESNFSSLGGGGLEMFSVGNVSIDGLVIDANIAVGHGGGAEWLSATDVNAKRLYVTGNRSGAGNGGGLMISGGSSGIVLSDSTVSDNAADLFAGGGIAVDNVEMTLNGVSFAENQSAREGGGIYIFESQVTATNTAFSSNSVNYSLAGTYEGGAAFVQDSVLDIANSALWGNVTHINTFGIPVSQMSEIVTGGSSTVTASHLCGENLWSDDSVKLDGSSPSLSDPFHRGAFGKLALRRTSEGESFTSACTGSGDPLRATAAFSAASLDWQTLTGAYYGAAEAYPPDAGALHSRPKVYYVRGAAGDDTKDGLTWANARKNIQRAVDVAGWGDQVWVDTVTQRGLTTVHTDPVFTAGRGVMVLGGFTGTELYPTGRTSGGRTAVTGDYDTSGSITPADAVHVIVAASDTRFERFDTTYGYDDSSDGGGCLLSGESFRVSVENSTFSHCQSTSQGGAVTAYPANFGNASASSLISLDQVSVSSSQAAQFGGGLAVFGGRGEIRNSAFSSNSSSTAAGALAVLFNAQSPASSLQWIVKDTTFTSNTSDQGGAAAFLGSGITSLTGLTFTTNQAATAGGALYVAGVVGIGTTKVYAADLTLDGNSAGDFGGAVFVGSDTLFRLVQGSFRSNTADFDSDGTGDGGAVYSANTAATPPDLVIENSAFYGNRDLNGGVPPPLVSDLMDDGTPTFKYEGICSEQDISLIALAPFVTLDGSTTSLGNPFATGALGELFLSQTAAGDSYTSACVDGGASSLTTDLLLYLGGRISLASPVFPYTTSSNGDPDDIFGGTPDMGRHYSEPKIIYVTKDGAGLADGTSWSNAAKGVQAGVNLASAGNKVWAKADTYTATSTATMLTVTSKPGVALFGGFGGWESQVSERAPGVYTTLDGNSTSRRLVDISGSSGFQVDGFRLTRGQNTLGGSSGVGIFISAASAVTVSNSRIDNNSTAGFGAGIRVSDSDLRIEASTIESNTGGTLAGAVYFGAAATPRLLDIGDSVVRSNTALSGDGGAIVFGGNNVARFSSRNTLYESNVTLTNQGGAIIALGAVSVALENDIFRGNQSPASNGGAMYISSVNVVGLPGTVVTATDVRWENNQASVAGGSVGGAIYMQRGGTGVPGLDITITRGEFVNNFTGNAGALAIRDVDASGVRTSIVRINGTRFEGNTGLSGPALFVDRPATLSVTGAKFIANRSTGLSGATHAGGAAFIRSFDTGLISDTLFWKNSLQKTGTNRGGALWVERNSGGAVILNVVNSAFRENLNPNGRGGAIGTTAGGGVLNVNVTNSTFDSNYSSDLGAGADINNFSGGTVNLNVWNSAFYGNLSVSSSTVMDVNRTPAAGTGNGAVNNSCGIQDFTGTMNVASAGNIILDGSAANFGDPFDRMATGELFLKNTLTGDAYTSACADIGNEAQATAVFATAGLSAWDTYTTFNDDPSLGGPYLDTDGGGATDVDAGVHYVPQDSLTYLPLRTPSFMASSAVLAAGSDVTLLVVPETVLTGCDIYQVATETYMGSIPGGPGTISGTFNLTPGIYRADCSEISGHNGSSYAIIREAVLGNLSNTGTENGKTWSTAWNTAPETATAAYPLWHDIWLKQGTYKATVGGPAFLTIPAYVGVYGGFEGTEASFPEVRLDRSQTVLSGDVNNNGVANAGDAGPVIQIGNESVLDGVTATTGFSTDAGIVLASAHRHLTIRNSVLTLGTSTAAGSGGGMKAPDYPAQLTMLENVRITQNTGGGTGGLSTDNGAHLLPRAELHMDGVTIDNNNSGQRSAALIRYTSSYITNSAILNNTNTTTSGPLSAPVFLGGVSGVPIHVWSNVTLAGNIGVSGTATGTGAIGINLGVVTFDNITVANNIGNGSGAILLFSGTPMAIRNSVFYGNANPANPALPDVDGVVGATTLDSVCSPQDFATTLPTVTITTTGPLLDGSTPALGNPFSVGPSGEVFLRHNGILGSTYTSACVDAGNDGLVPFAFAAQTTDASGALDTGTSDVGRHYDPSATMWITDFHLVNGGDAIYWATTPATASCEIRNADVPAQVVYSIPQDQLSQGNWPIPSTGASPQYTLYCTDSSGNSTSATILGSNQAPVAATDTGFATTENGAPVVIQTSQLLSNDTDANGDAISYVDAGTVSASGITITPAGNTLVYDPNLPGGVLDYLSEGELLTDTFTYRITDSNGSVSTGTVQVTVTGVNDPAVPGAYALTSVFDGDSFTVPHPAITDPDSNDVYTYADASAAVNRCSLLPGAGGGAWYSVDTVTGEISGTAPALGADCTIDLQMTEPGGNTVTNTLTISSNTRYVTTLGDGFGNDGSGDSWTDAHNAGFLQAGITEAQALSGGTGQVLIGAGSMGSPAVANGSLMAVTASVRIYGGLAETENSILDRASPVDASLTVLDGDYDISGTPTAADAYHVVTVTGASGVVIDGLTVRGGNAAGAGNLNGGGIFVTGATGTRLTNLVISGNTASQLGGGMMITDSPEFTLDSVVVTANTSGLFGGGVNIDSSTVTPISTGTISNSVFRTNGSLASPVTGGGLRVSSTVTDIANVTFDGNGTSGGGGAIDITAYATIGIRHCSFRNNFAGNFFRPGGAIVSSGFSRQYVIENSTFYGNLYNGATDDIYDDGFALTANTRTIRSTCSAETFTGSGNITLDGSSPEKGDPFRSSLDGSRVYLKQASQGDAYTSACVDSADALVTTQTYADLGLDWTQLTTAFQGDSESGQPDMGVHYTQPVRIYVTAAGNDANDGLTWATAKATPQGGIDAASSGGSVWLKDDIFTATGPGDMADLKSGIAFVGGFNGTESAYRQKDVAAKSTLDGGGVAPVLYAGFVDGLHLEGIRLINGVADYGPGAYVEFSDNVTMSHAEISANSANFDVGGMYIDSVPGIALSDVVIDGNQASDNGGGLYVTSSTGVSLTGISVTNNAADDYGSLWIDNSDAVVTDLTVTDNFITSGFGYAAGMEFDNSAVSVDGGIVRSNAGGASQFGGGAYIYQSSVVLSDLLFKANTGGDGASLYAEDSNVMVTNSAFNGNQAESGGGGLYAFDSGGGISTMVVENCSFRENVADSDFSAEGDGGAIANEGSDLTVRNSVFFGNLAQSTVPVSISDLDVISGSVTVDYACSEEDLSLYGTGSVVLDKSSPALDDPFTVGLQNELFLKQTSQGDLYTSACVNAGDNASATAAYAAAGLADWTTLTTGVGSDTDSGNVDMGVHYTPATRWYLGPTSSGSGNGTSWLNRSGDLQSVLDSAGPYDHVWMAVGTYKTAADDVSAVADAAGDVYLFGGFGGTEATFAQRAGYYTQTVLNGDNDGNGGDAGDSQTVLTGAKDFWIDGFRITGGYNDTTVTNGAGARWDGGGTLHLRRMTVDGNLCFIDIGGLYADGGAGDTVIVENSSFSRNTTVSGGGGGLSLFAENIGLDGVTADHNSVQYGAGGIYLSGTNVSVRRTQILSNTATVLPVSGFGGGSIIVANNLEFTDSVVSGNYADTAGGGLELQVSGTATVANSVISNNTAGWYGGGVDSEGGDLTVTNVLLDSNVAGLNGAGGWNVRNTGSAVFTNVTFVDNRVEDSLGAPVGKDAAMTTSAAGTVLRNTAVYGSVSFSGTQFGADPGGSYSIDYACSERDLAADFGATNFTLLAVDPFVRIADGTVFLDPASPCVDAGDDSYADDSQYGFLAMGRKDWAELTTDPSLVTDDTPVDDGAHADPAAPFIYTFGIVTGRTVQWVNSPSAVSACEISGGNLVYPVSMGPDGMLTLSAGGTYTLTCSGDVRYVPAVATLVVP